MTPLPDTAYANTLNESFFDDAKEHLNTIITELESDIFTGKEHGDIESYINKQGHEVMRRLLQGHFNNIAIKEVAVGVSNSGTGKQLNHVRHKTTRTLTSQFGNVAVTRMSYSQRKESSYFPQDKKLNLAKDQYSDGVRHRTALEAAKNSFDNVVEAIDSTTAGHVPKRQCINIVQDIAQDFEAFYKGKRFNKPEKTKDLLVLSFDGKGVVMRKEGLRECTRKSAEKRNKLESRLSAGEKKDRKRMAMVAAVYTVTTHERTAESIMNIEVDQENVLPFRAPIRSKRVWASLERNGEEVIREGFQEALQRDPKQKRPWVILIDGLPSQIKIINKIKRELNVKATIVMDFIHVLEYLWTAARCFFEVGDTDVEQWVSCRAVRILKGGCSQVAKGIRQSATKQGIINRDGVDKCADYLLNNKCRLKYDEALDQGFPIASGVIEGACRHLINDRLDITGARWGLPGAEAILKLRSIKSSGDFDKYWKFYKEKSKARLYSGFQIGHNF